jgi:hypothetical protein
MARVSNAMLGPGDPLPLESLRPEGCPKRWCLSLAISPGDHVGQASYILSVVACIFHPSFSSSQFSYR